MGYMGSYRGVICLELVREKVLQKGVEIIAFVGKLYHTTPFLHNKLYGVENWYLGTGSTKKSITVAIHKA